MKTITLRQNVEFCLLKIIDNWYINQLTHINKINLRNDFNNVKKWCDALKTRFYDSLKKSFILLKTIWYIIKKTYNKKNFVNYIFNIVFNIKNVNIIIIDTIKTFFVYKHINNEIKRNLFKFTKSSTMFNLIEKLRYQKIFNLLFTKKVIKQDF